MTEETDKPELIFTGEAPTSVDVFYEKSRQHRTIYADGIWAGITPSSEIQLVLFKNLEPVPEYIRQAVNPDHSVGKEIETSVRKGMIREYETTLILSIETARAMVALVTQVLERKQAIEDKLTKDKEQQTAQ